MWRHHDPHVHHDLLHARRNVDHCPRGERHPIAMHPPDHDLEHAWSTVLDTTTQKSKIPKKSGINIERAVGLTIRHDGSGGSMRCKASTNG